MTHNCSYWVRKFREDFFQRGSSETTWNGDYWKILKRLPMDKTLTRKVLHETVLSTPVNTKTRKRACMVIGQMARFAKIDYDPSPYAGKYSPDAVDPRSIPSDELIAEWHDRLQNPGWKWVLGVIATYGIRPHEAFRLEFDILRSGDRVLQVKKETKTGNKYGVRQVWAYHPEWFETFRLWEVRLPPINLDRSNSANGESAAHYFHDFGLPFHLMDLRHAWAIRSMLYGLDYKLAARMMGHSYPVHERIYHRWINRSVLQSAYEASLKNPNRPLPPKRTEE